MIVRRIALNGWRNYTFAAAEFSPGTNVITGENAQGKTNLLEAVYLLTGGKSFRTRFDRELIGFGYTGAEVLADVYAFGREQTVRVVLRQGQRKQIWQNGAKKTAAELAGNFAAVLFCPDDLNIIRDGPAARRRMMDMAISQLRPKYGALLAEYSRLYDQKSAILRDWHEKPSLLDTLDDFSDQMCRVSAKLIRYRAAYASRLNIAAAPIHADFSGGRDKLTLAYRTVSTVTDALGTEKEIYYALCDHQEQHRRAELDSGQCLTGAHKDDLLIDINGQPARAFASQGQTRTAALSLKLAEREIFHDEFDEYPVLMLDDVLSELDAQRQAFVLNRIGGGQTLITCCEDARIAERTGGRVLTVQNGGIRGCIGISAIRSSRCKRACSACSTWTPPHGRTARARHWKNSNRPVRWKTPPGPSCRSRSCSARLAAARPVISPSSTPQHYINAARPADWKISDRGAARKEANHARYYR